MRVLAVALVVALLSATASAQACIPCSQCQTDHCLRYCSASCDSVTPDDVVVSGDGCKATGQDYGPVAATAACETTKRYCGRGYVSSFVGSVGPVTLGRCAAIALGECQSAASSSWDCTYESWMGSGACTRSQFYSFFKGEIEGRCRNWARTVTDVDPYTNQWISNANPQYVASPGGRKMMM